MSNRWGNTPPEVEEIWAFPGTWGDKNRGVLVDWSGLTAVIVCLDPGCGQPQFGPIFNLAELSHSCEQHRRNQHPRETNKDGSPRLGAVPVSNASQDAARSISACWNCGTDTKKIAARGVCASCRLKLGLAWAIEKGYLIEGSTQGDLRRLIDGFYETPEKDTKPKAPIHGTYNEYTRNGCRCVECRKASSDYRREYRARKQAV